MSGTNINLFSLKCFKPLLTKWVVILIAEQFSFGWWEVEKLCDLSIKHFLEYNVIEKEKFK